jgi:SanA protein
VDTRPLINLLRNSIQRLRGNTRQILFIALGSTSLVLILLVGLRGYSSLYARDRIFEVDSVPKQPVAIIFGAQVYRSGRPSPMLADRIRVGVELYQAGKVKALLMTGDNGIDTYNEPEAMRQYALSLGVPDQAIVLDYAGFRTYDSCYRARDIFQVKHAILVTQAFHLDRSILTCNSLGIDSFGVAADVVRPIGYSRASMLSSQLREYPSTLLSIVDLLFRQKPTFLGDPLPIFPDTP